ncbi:acyl-CoA/acyl-ACP dehydrogenase [Frankia sp. CNm7]|uniref:Acyl-CoA/acyl-ACP dehydrogenase n=1 Tax=Frankia nepalensis TaxID=1836974 RepID=A0A937R822_9ACTN|nr:acyl-CoA dehydrogenase family protein [Frankia nepalensis]MBL7496669.1 acyl-CoA/acyl-ACP dehydrogenase [Frankia nepalensis]MBL7510689.1 acyl-CoA/acyl-ACP dehydrogenase [Frankia nepalensis]MBL7516678.1 acyl-CoA/acyl-ACP dehydrogenase [Frankia nepalensis]MBL7627408.1 acyl-CoA/acyl-ACP dehydrogenase [Frankia nepalensis]
MSIGLDEDHAALADAVRGFVSRHAGSERVRAGLDRWVAGAAPDYWRAIVEQGLTWPHLPENLGGAEAGEIRPESLAPTLRTRHRCQTQPSAHGGVPRVRLGCLAR